MIINKKINLFFLVALNLTITFLLLNPKIETIKLKQDDITIVSSYYKIKSKHKPREYMDWINNIVKLNKSIVFFSDKRFMPHLKRIRPKKFYNKTIFHIVEMEDFYSYKNFLNEFTKSWKMDKEKNIHTIPLYLIWAEKCNFLKRVIKENYFNSTCFYWVDVGYFREKSEMNKYAENWPSTKKCYEDPRILMAQVRYFSAKEKKKIINFDIHSHLYLQENYNVAGNIFGGKALTLLKFINLYYSSIKLFIQKNIFIGKDQNIFAYIAFSHPQIVKLVYCNSFFGLNEYLS